MDAESNPQSLDERDVRTIREALTWGDQHEARKSSDNPSDVAAYAMWRAARRIGMVPADVKLEEFLDAIPVAVMEGVLSEPRDPTSADTAS